MLGLKRRVMTILALLLICLPLAVCAGRACAEDKALLRTYVVYDGEFRFGVPQPVLTSLMEFLGHFDLEQIPLASDDWKPGALADADMVVFLGLRGGDLPGGMLDEITGVSERGRVIWFERGVAGLAKRLGWSDFIALEPASGWLNVSTRHGPRAVPSWARVAAARPGSGADIFMRVRDFEREEPLSWRRGGVYYLGCLDFFVPSMRLALTDLLHRAIPKKYAQARSAPRRMLLRVEDVSPSTDPRALRRILETIQGFDIPYAIGVISVSVAEDGSALAMSESPEVASLLRDAQERGASVIMHGYAHGNEFSPLTGEGFEFWNARADKPMPDDEAFTRSRVEAAFAELARCGLWPVAFEAPHYAMSKKGYEVVSEFFNTCSGQVQISDESYTITLALPYITKSPYVNGMTLIPENLGYYDGGENNAEALLGEASALLETDAPFGCFFYHGYLPDAEPLREAISGALRMGYSFFDLRELDIRAESKQVRVTVANGAVSGKILDPEILNTAGWGVTHITAANLGRAQALLMTLAILSIVGLIFRLRKNAWKKYEVDEG